MSFMTGNDIRSSFLDYFRKKQHQIIHSSSLVPKGDPTLLFTNAGMVQFKDVFLGSEKRDYKRAVSSQKCVRAGGKHNDLEVVGRTARHHTFFEMLGNFSFGDYFKEDAIHYGWAFLTQVMKLPEEKLWITIYKDDEEAFKIWNEKNQIPPEKIVRLGEKDNFWSMGETGPCGPCSEILFDQGEGIGCKRSECNVECDCGRFLELWNLVFMQHNRDEKGTLTPLPKPCVDTGLGLERLSSVMQNVHSNYDTDLIKPIILKISKLTGKNYGHNKDNDISLKVIADHARAVTFLVGDGVMPSNEGRGYVLRRILRRALRHGRMLGQEKPFLHKIAGRVIELMKDAYPELINMENYISKVVLNEEERFSNTLNFGMNLLEEKIKKLKENSQKTFPGDEVFKLYDTYGFPVDLSEDIVNDAGLKFDSAGFQKAMDSQKDKARAAWKGSGEEGVKKIYKALSEKIPPTQFEGFDALKTEGTLLAIIKKDSITESASSGDEIDLVFDKTVFYGESGGQVGDAGKISGDSIEIQVLTTHKPLSSLFVHSCKIKSGIIKKGVGLTLQVDMEDRQATALNHTATHLLQAALKEVLGDHVKQAGSLVEKNRFRFDYTHFSPLTSREKEKIEEIVNQKIMENIPVQKKTMPIDEAIKEGATAIFGEKYGDEVRVVNVEGFSKELCGGTHVNATGEVGFYRIVSEGGIAAGVRRIEAITGKKAFQRTKNEEASLVEIRKCMNAQPEEEVEKVKKMLKRIKELEKEVARLKEKLAHDGGSHDIFSEVKKNEGVSILVKELEEADAATLRTFIDNAKNKLGSGIIAVGSKQGNNVFLAAGVTKDLTKKYHAGKIIKEIAAIVGGSGGGRPDMAQAGGKFPEKLSEALKKVFDIVKK